ncbi:methylated-DNA--[protein]-cysteine S-methyltransferase [Orrella daihaiensis]|uniref:Methylated-DNA--[protein]-cysteine S-methyltransferase n=1 Tax=Orrella daihaiensis TaxID=2782176 RepID=A0ABY4AQ80_9BURK|nr:methylated-DNA--[protein]-cysteine S-methyltransferase [Orrella daihaiensis]UOD51187.1 methylated-DNA--[protein]-cysteine S-methyltransferase [Orrella daihaiensis]
MYSIVEFASLKHAPYKRLTIGLAKTPVGPAVLVWDALGIRELSLDKSPQDVLLRWSVLDRQIERDDATADQCVAKVFEQRALDLPLVFCGTDFQRKVWQQLMQIKRGQTTSYSELASRLGKPSAARAVGGAVGANLLGFVVPCHRVVRQDGLIGEFRWGTEVKASLLAWESRLAYG